MSLLVASDFVGVYKISADNFSSIEDYINQYEQMYIRAIIGDENASNMLILANLTQKYLDLWNGVNYTGFSDLFTTNSGMKTALIGFIYFHYISDNFTNTNVGNVYNSNENSSNTDNTTNGQIAVNRFNTSVLNVREDVNTFLSFYNSITTTSTGSSEVATDYTILIPTTKYLEVGNTINVGGADYVVTAIDSDVSFNITASTGMDFNNSEVIWHPFFKSIINNLNIIVI